jgi:hypothetical protein
MFIPDLIFWIPDPGSKRFWVPDPDPHSRISIFNPKKLFLSFWKYDPGCSSRIQTLFFTHPGSRGKKAQDPGSGSATLEKNRCRKGWGRAEKCLPPLPPNIFFYRSVDIQFKNDVQLKKRFTSFPSPDGMSLTKLPQGRNNSVMTSLFPPRESLVVTSRLGTGNSRTFFYGVTAVILLLGPS